MQANQQDLATGAGPARSGLVGADPASATASEVGAHFAVLAREVRAAGLLDLAPKRYYARLAFNAAMFGAGLVAFFLIGDSWWQLAVAAWMGLSCAQSAFMWHDAGHKAMFRGRAATAMGLIHANLVNGVSYGWWVNHHNRHHSFPNNIDLDPDIGRRTAIFDMSQYATRTRWGRFVVRHQRTLFFVLLIFEGYKMRRTSLLAVFNGNLRQPVQELVLILANMAVYLGLLFVVLSPVKAVAFVVVQQAVLGVYFGLIFAPNHKGMEVRAGEESLDWLERQVLTSRNIRPSPLVDFLYGGLNYQVEHHLFPTMPRMNLNRCRPIVQRYCGEHDIPYREVTLFESYREVASFLHEVSEPARRPLPVATGSAGT
ncbi:MULTISPECIES: acyl-CoA desaturase [unclassified Solwaraspora]|uniref:fatty acid desaturase family protein n=1 Tax=unclassified Solwaraspora TaxID=2627926 RepID=UPI00248C2A99|nr:MULTISPECIES: acyl-CoA desaturase [unclassified Solwaraspora]WBB95640.1 acyl-CoA desaturase [Solwaraspora sp. WMMA2059]WBC20456.1 acyl-CoA desaturase [Solwaraspora sp. WMMA2080]WJK37391.1 acyl-CoA desaturase [Solwaraspora sp. WMMA2065]